MEKCIVTVGRKFQPAAVKLAKQIAVKLNLPYIERGRESCQTLRQLYGAEFILLAKNQTLVLDTPSGELFFHPGMAHTRLKNLAMGKQDHLIEAMNLTEGMSVLDCTLGMAADALVAASVVGANGQVVGLEANALVATVIGYSLAHSVGENYIMHTAMRKIEVKCAEHGEFLRRLPDNSFDVVYFDPMFRHPLSGSNNLDPLRALARMSALDPASVTEALRVARQRVVLKESCYSSEFSRLGFTHISGGRYSRVKYGIIEK